MNLTTQQLQTLKADILADPTLSAQPNNSDGAFAIAAAYNLPASPDFWCWKSSVSKDDLVGATGPDGTVFDWTAYIGRTAAEKSAFTEIFSSAGLVNPSRPNVRQAFTDIFSGAGGAGNRTHLASVSRRKVTRLEKLFATGTGSTASPGTMAVEGGVSYQDVETARNS